MPLSRTGSYRNDGRTIVVGVSAGSVGTLTATGSGLQLSLLDVAGAADDFDAGGLIVGAAGTGTLSVTNRAVVRVQSLQVADQGPEARGTVTISGGARVSSFADRGEAPSYLGVEVGIAAGSRGTVTVTGPGSILESTGGAGRVRLGNYGTGVLALRDGAEARGFFWDIGRNDGGRGIVTVDGVGTRLVASDQFGAFDEDPGEAGFLRLGRNAGSYGRLAITNGGRVDVINDPTYNFDGPLVIVGANEGARGVLVVDGAGSTLAITMTGASNDGFGPLNGYGDTDYFGPALRLGSSGGSGAVTVRNGGLITVSGEAARVLVGQNTPTDGTQAENRLAIQAGGTVEVSSVGTELRAQVEIGGNYGAQGLLSVSGAGARLIIRTDNVDDVDGDGDLIRGARLYAGRNGDGALVVSQGGQVVIDGADDRYPGLLVASGYGASGTVTVTGAGSSITVLSSGRQNGSVAGLIGVGYDGGNALPGSSATQGTLTIEAGGRVANAAGNSVTTVAHEVGTAGTVVVRGEGTRLDAGALLSIANALDLDSPGDVLPVAGDASGFGQLVIDDGGRVTAGQTVVGRTSFLTLRDGALTGDVEIRGTLDLNTGDPGTPPPPTREATVIDGDLHFADGSDWRFRLDSGIDGVVERLDIRGDLSGVADLDLALFVEAEVRFGRGQRIVIAEADSVTAVSQDLGDFRLRNLGDTLVLIADVSRGGFSLDRSGSASNDIILTDNAGGVKVRAGALSGETATGVSLIDGSAAADRIVSAAGLTRAMTIAAGAGDDVVQTSGGANTVHGGAGNDAITSREGADLLFGGLGNDTLNAGAGADSVAGDAGNDSLIGGADADTLEGGEGADRIEGGAGTDRLVGGLGRDVFVFRAGFGEDRVVDFDATQERLDFRGHSGVDGLGDLTIRQSGSATLVTDDSGGRLVLIGVDRADLTEADFVF